jgi:hypothetical protein
MKYWDPLIPNLPVVSIRIAKEGHKVNKLTHQEIDS